MGPEHRGPMADLWMKPLGFLAPQTSRCPGVAPGQRCSPLLPQQAPVAAAFHKPGSPNFSLAADLLEHPRWPAQPRALGAAPRLGTPQNPAEVPAGSQHQNQRCSAGCARLWDWWVSSTRGCAWCRGRESPRPLQRAGIAKLGQQRNRAQHSAPIPAAPVWVGRDLNPSQCQPCRGRDTSGCPSPMSSLAWDIPMSKDVKSSGGCGRGKRLQLCPGHPPHTPWLEPGRSGILLDGPGCSWTLLDPPGWSWVLMGGPG